MSHIKKVYKDLVLKYHPDKNKGKNEEEGLEIRKKFYAIQTAFETIKEEKGAGVSSASDEEYDDGGIDIVGASISTGITTLIYLLILYCMYYSVAFVFTIVDWTFNYFFYTCIVHSVLDLFFAHYFDSSESQNLATIFIALIIVWYKRRQRPNPEASAEKRKKK